MAPCYGCRSPVEPHSTGVGAPHPHAMGAEAPHTPTLWVQEPYRAPQHGCRSPGCPLNTSTDAHPSIQPHSKAPTGAGQGQAGTRWPLDAGGVAGGQGGHTGPSSLTPCHCRIRREGRRKRGAFPPPPALPGGERQETTTAAAHGSLPTPTPWVCSPTAPPSPTSPPPTCSLPWYSPSSTLMSSLATRRGVNELYLLADN